MADFRSHIVGSTLVGAAYGYYGQAVEHLPLETCLIAGGLCSVSGMLPDLDSESGVPLREATTFGSAVIPMLMVERFNQLDLRPETMVLITGGMYCLIRFVVVAIFKKYTVHRGMWHSVPAAISAGLLAYLLMHSMNEQARVYKSVAVFLGFMVHLIMDEIWALNLHRGRFRIKKSFGTAMKFWGSSPWGNVSVYAKLFLLAYLVYCDHGPLEMPRRRDEGLLMPRVAEPAPEADDVDRR